MNKNWEKEDVGEDTKIERKKKAKNHLSLVRKSTSLVIPPKLAKLLNWIALTTYSMHRKEKMNAGRKGGRKES